MLKLVLILLGFLIFSPIPAYAQDVTATPYFVDHITCGGHEFKIPQFPLVLDKTDSLYLTYDETTCTPDKIEITLGLTKDCRGQNACMVGKFGIMKVDDAFRNHLERAMKSAHGTVKITDTQGGYFSPSECNATCTPSQLTWFDGGYAYMLDSIVDMNVQEKMLKAARDYIAQNNAESK